jgi:tRNA A-37 threonylcarbamoyl transferase component Bud32
MTPEKDNKNNAEDDLWESIYVSAREQKQKDVEQFEETLRTYPQYELLGQGGVKAVFKSYDWKTKRDIALAVPSTFDSDQTSEEFINEAQVLGQLEHPNIIPVYDAGYDEEKQPYFTMKLVEGLDLAEYSDNEMRTSAFLKKLPEYLDIFRQVCMAVAYAHSKNVVHHDIKPENILIGKFGQVFLCDWGIALKLKSDNHPSLNLRLNGTPGFLAPEVFESKTDKRSDIYSLGCLLYFILSGRPPLKSNDMDEVLQKVKESNFPPLTEVCDYGFPESMAHIYEKCCAFDVGERYQSVSEVIDEIDLYSNGFATNAEDASLLRYMRLMYGRNNVIINVVLASFILLCVSSFYYLVNLNQAMSNLERTVLELKESNEMILKEKEKTEQYAAELIKKELLAKKYIVSMTVASDHLFKKRPEAMVSFLEKIHSLSPNHIQTKFKLAKYYIGLMDWVRASQASKDLFENLPKYSKKLEAFIGKYSGQIITEDLIMAMIMESKLMHGSFHEITSALTIALLEKNYDRKKKRQHILRLLKSNTKAKDVSYDYENKTLVISDAEISDLDLLTHLEIDILKLQFCQLNSRQLDFGEIIEIDLRNSKTNRLNFSIRGEKLNLVYLPESKKAVQLVKPHNIQILYLPESSKGFKWRSFKGVIKFY